MLFAKKVGFWRNSYEIANDGQFIARWEKSHWKSGGTFELDGRRFEVHGNLWGSKYGMVTSDGIPVASADRVGRKRWMVDAGGRIFEFQRASMWRHEETLLSDGREVGSVRRASMWRGDTVADLPGLPLEVQIFVLVVVLTKWDAAAASAASSGAGAG
jgi:hypothetical protein